MKLFSTFLNYHAKNTWQIMRIYKILGSDKKKSRSSYKWYGNRSSANNHIFASVIKLWEKMLFYLYLLDFKQLRLHHQLLQHKKKSQKNIKICSNWLLVVLGFFLSFQKSKNFMKNMDNFFWFEIKINVILYLSYGHYLILYC